MLTRGKLIIKNNFYVGKISNVLQFLVFSLPSVFQGCNAAFTSIMGYLYHMKKCGKEESELEKMLLSCSHCGKNYKSKAGLEYHLKSEHAPVSPAVFGAFYSP